MEQKLRLWYKQPAACHEETLPIGNGSLGAMIFGGVDKEVLALNEDSLWSGYDREKNRPEAKEYLPLVRQLIQEGKFADVEKMIQDHMLGEYTEGYLPLGQLTFTYTYNGSGCITEYERELLLNDATASVSYRVGGTKYQREYFASYPARAILIRLTCEKPEMDISIRFDSLLAHASEAKMSGGDICIHVNGQCPEHVDPSYRRQDNQIIQGTKGQCFNAKCEVLSADGTVRISGEEIHVTNATSIVLAFSAVKDAEIGDGDFELLKRVHMEDYQRIFKTVEFYLGEQKEEPTDIRLEMLRQEDNDPALYALYFQYGRYLLIASSRKGGQPANLQGIWSWKLQAPWSCNWTTNINLEMNYWHACSCNLLECMEPYFELLKRVCENGKKTAMTHYGCRGSVLHHNTDYWASTNPTGIFYGTEKGYDGCVTWSFWVLGEAWLSRELYQYYEYTGDMQFLKNTAYPILKENVLFLNDWLVEKDGVYEAVPSTSPENRFLLPDGRTCCVSKNCAMDLELIREVFMNYQRVCSVLELEDELLEEIDEKLEHLAPLQVGSKGQLLEWAEEYTESEPGHRHMSQVYGMYPSELFANDYPMLDACKRALELRIENGGGYTGWSCAWLVNLFSVLEDKENAYKYLYTLLTKSTYNNLWDAHPPFQIDGNFGGSAGIANMLVQDRGGKLKVLPALPESWKNGYVKGLRIKKNQTIDIQWENGKAVDVKIR